jgi:hypothetical protein
LKTSSAKAKGRRLQQEVRDGLRTKVYLLEDGDVESRGMGQSGVDIILSPAARRILDLAIECKNCETLNVHKIFTEHYNKYKDSKALKILVHSKNRSETLATLKWTDLLVLLDLAAHQNGTQTQ